MCPIQAKRTNVTIALSFAAAVAAVLQGITSRLLSNVQSGQSSSPGMGNIFASRGGSKMTGTFGGAFSDMAPVVDTDSRMVCLFTVARSTLLLLLQNKYMLLPLLFATIVR